MDEIKKPVFLPYHDKKSRLCYQSHEKKIKKCYSQKWLQHKQEIPSRQLKSAKKGSERYLMFGPNHILVTLMWDDGRSPGHEMSVGGS